MSAMVSIVANFQVFWNLFWQCKIPSLWNEWFPLQFPFLGGWMGKKENFIKNFVYVRRACPFDRNSFGGFGNLCRCQLLRLQKDCLIWKGS
jgi:hypothetical protein